MHISVVVADGSYYDGQFELRVIGVDLLIPFHSPVQIGFLAFNVHGIDGIQPEPGGERETVLVRPFGQRWQNDGLQEELEVDN